MLALICHTTAFAQNTKFAAWSVAPWTDAPFPLQTIANDPRLERQHEDAGFAAAFPGHLYIIFPDEPDQPQGEFQEIPCQDPAAVAARYATVVAQIKAADPTARFSPGGFAERNPAPCQYDHFIEYAQRFYDALPTPKPQIDEWRFHHFIDPANVQKFKDDVTEAANWAVAHGAPMVLGSWGRPDIAGLSEPIMRDLMNFIDANPNIVSAVWWTYDLGTPNQLTVDLQQPRTLSLHGQIYREYATRQVSAPRSGANELASFDADAYADYADLDIPSGQFWVHRNLGGSFDTFGHGPSFAAGGADWEVLVADFTNDGLADYADVHVPSGAFWIHANVGGFAFGGVWASGVAASGATHQLLAADANQDGFADIIEHDRTTGQIFARKNPGVFGGSFNTYINADANGVGRQSLGTSKVGSAWRLIVGDFTGDGIMDFADHYTPLNMFWVHKGAFWNNLYVVSSAVHGTGQGSVGGVWNLVFGDFTGDGRTDFADLHVPSGLFWVHANQNDGKQFDPGNWGSGQSAAGANWQILGSR